MSSQRYERVSTTDVNDHATSAPRAVEGHVEMASPPPSFRSAASSPTTRHFLHNADYLMPEPDSALADSFDHPSDAENSDDEAGEDDQRQRLMRSQTNDASTVQSGQAGRQRSATLLPTFPVSTGAVSVTRATDGVFANMDAKPEVGEKTEEQPPTYEQAAADATPPYWESTVLVPGGVGPDEVYIDGLPVGSVFAFLWNGMISMSFQVVGFLLTYLLHTTHAAKNGSRAGLGITMIQYGFYMKGSGKDSDIDATTSSNTPADPNSHDFSPSAVEGSTGSEHLGGSDILAYALMVVGWFILIRAVSDFLRARHMKAVVMQTPDRGLGVAVVAEGENAETAV